MWGLLSRVARGVPARWRSLWVVGVVFVSVNMAVRVGLALFDGDLSHFRLLRLLGVLTVGTVYDLAALTWVLVPFALLALAVPGGGKGRQVHGVLASTLLLAGLFGMMFTATAEFLFWNEFSARFNFIAVDYLIYTREVIGNIRESYPMGLIFTALGIAALGLFVMVRRAYWQAATADGGHWKQRLAAFVPIALLPVLAFVVVGDGPREQLATAGARELAGNGYYDFMRAFRANDLDYRTFYRTLAQAEASAVVREEVLQGNAAAQLIASDEPVPVRRVAPAQPMLRKNVVLVSMESMGADFIEAYGGREGLTPNLNALAHDGLQFLQVYATGLRTVRGLEALTLSMPPTPGHAVPMRHRNTGFQTLGGVFAEQGYEALYLYGGYGYFDNMRNFFGGNGYTVVDRTAIDARNITHENIWGVADEDLFHQAVREIDARVAAGKPVFAHIMTTSNHRPFTYPAGRIDIPSGAGREGGVKYADWAIGSFMAEAKTKPWFSNTLFVFVADHTANGRGRTDLPPENYHIPLIMVGPGWLSAGVVPQLASQIDVGPTILGLLQVPYTSHFFGQDILQEGKGHQRAFMANYLTVGYMQDGLVVELQPRRQVRVVDALTGRTVPDDDPRSQTLIKEAVAYYQEATDLLRGDSATSAAVVQAAPAHQEPAPAEAGRPAAHRHT